MRSPYFAVVNPAAGGGRCGKLAAAALEKLRAAGLDLKIAETRAPGQAIPLVREAYQQGYLRFLAVGGDGTAYEIVNGLFPEAAQGERPTLGFLPLGTGNSFLRDFTERGAEHAVEALLAGRRRACDVLRLTHAGGVLYFINLLSFGFAAEVAVLTNRRFKRLRELGYLLGVFTCVVRLKHPVFALRVDEEKEFDRRPCLLLSFNNSKYTGGKMMIAPLASTDDGFIEFVRWGPIGRLGLIRTLPALYDGSHIHRPLASRRAARRIEFALEGPVNAVVDGETLVLHCRQLEVLPGALDVAV